jgi:transposase
MPVKDNTGISITSALKSLYQNRKPITIQSEKGSEFVNTSVRQYLKRQGVKFQKTHNSDIEGGVTESFNKSLKLGCINI